MKSNLFENEFMDLVKKQQILQWENYAKGKNNNLNRVNKLIFEYINNNYNKSMFSGRKKDYFSKLALKYQIENDSEIAYLRNKLDDKKNYISSDFSDQSNSDYKLELSKRMSSDVVNIIKLRNYKARELEFASYPDLIFHTEELEKDCVVKSIKNFLDKNLSKANLLIEKYNLSWDNWFTNLREAGQLKNIDPEYYIENFLDKLNLNHIRSGLKFDFIKQPISGIAFCISSPEDIRILLKPLDSIFQCKTLFHETGHGINYTSNQADGIYNLFTNSFDETMAVIWDNIGIKICLSDQEQEIAKDIKLLEAIRTAISFLFEIKLWKNPESAEVLFEQYYSKLDITMSNPKLWSLDSFRYIDPVYVYNYSLGEIYAKKIISILERNFAKNYLEWGNILTKHFLHDGMEESWINKYNSFKEVYEV